MAGARPSTFKKGGGGFLNNVDGVITGYEFTDVFPGGGKKKKGGSDFHSLFCILSVRVDGKDEDDQTTLFAGNADEWTIEDDGHTLVPNEEGQGIGGNSGFGLFLSTLTEANFPEDLFPEDAFNWEAMIGTRVRFVQRKNEASTAKAGQRVAKNGKKYDRTDVVVDQVYELPGKKGKAGKGTAEKTSTKGKKNDDAGDDDDLDALAAKFLIKVVAANKGKMAKAKVSMQLLKPENGLFKHPQREAIRKLLTSDKFLNTEEGWSYDEDSEVIKVKAAKEDDDE